MIFTITLVSPFSFPFCSTDITSSVENKPFLPNAMPYNKMHDACIHLYLKSIHPKNKERENKRERERYEQKRNYENFRMAKAKAVSELNCLSKQVEMPNVYVCNCLFSFSP